MTTNKWVRIAAATVMTGALVAATLFEGQSSTFYQQLSVPDALDVIRLRTRLEGWIELLPSGLGFFF